MANIALINSRRREWRCGKVTDRDANMAMHVDMDTDVRMWICV